MLSKEDVILSLYAESNKKQRVKPAIELYFKPYEFNEKALRKADPYHMWLQEDENEISYIGSNPDETYSDEMMRYWLQRYAYRCEYIYAPKRDQGWDYALTSEKTRQLAYKLDQIKDSFTCDPHEVYQQLEQLYGVFLRQENVHWVYGLNPFFSGEWNNGKYNYTVVPTASLEECQVVLKYLRLRQDEEHITSTLALYHIPGNVTVLPQFRYYAHNWEWKHEK